MTSAAAPGHTRLPGVGCVVTCEHGGREIPARWGEWFDGAEPVLASHRGWDLGVGAFYEAFVTRMADAGRQNTISRLLVDVNRSLSHPRLHSEWAKAMPDALRARAVEEVWRPYRSGVEGEIARLRELAPVVLHLSLHTFTPVLAGRVRPVDVGFLYDPKRSVERGFAFAWRRELQSIEGSFRVRMNQPYRGVSDGFTKSLRRSFGEGYLGIELELNQALVAGQGEREGRALAEPLVVACERAARAFLVDLGPSGGYPPGRSAERGEA